MQTLLQDLRFGLRMLRESPAFTAAAVLTLALGIGANTVIFSVVNAVLLQPLPVPDSENVVRLQERHERATNVTGATFQDVRLRNHVFSSVAAYRVFSQNLSDLGHAAAPEEIDTAFVSQDFLTLLKTPPALGRGFDPAQFGQRAEGELLLSYSLWQRHFAADRDIVGKRILLHGNHRVIVGVMPRGFSFPDQVQTWVPLRAEDAFAENRRAHLFRVIARVKPGVSPGAVRNDLQVIATQIQQENHDVDPGFVFSAPPLQENMVAEVRPALLLLVGAVGFVLLIACANVANLLLSRSFAREKETAVRIALGAGTFRLVRQFLTESLLLGAAGGILGCLTGLWCAKLAATAYSGFVPRLDTLGPRFAVWVYVAAVSVLATLLFGVLPAFQLSQVSLGRQLAEGGRTTVSATRSRIRSLLVMGEVALAIVLLTGGGLLIRSFLLLQRVNPGYETSHLLVAAVTLPDVGYSDLEHRLRFVNSVLERVGELPGVRAAAAGGALPFRPVAETDFDLEGHSYSPGEEPSAQVLTASPEYFRAMGIRLLTGRTFNAQDVLGKPVAVVINQTMADRYWLHENALGKKLVMKDWGPPLPGSVVGIVSDVKVDSLETVTQPAVYYSLAQFPEGTLTTYLIVRTKPAPQALVGAVRNQIWAVDRQQPVNLFTMEQVISESLQRRRFILVLLGSFAAIALVLAIVGIYGVVSYSVGQRTREFGLRLAVGAQRQQVLVMVMKQGFTTVAIGAGLGVTASLLLTPLLRSLLFEVHPVDPLTFLIVPGLLLAAALAATYIPARRATKVDPIVALRYE
jgi:putative ABC transport system permease protein